MKEKTPLLDEFVCFQIKIKDFQLEVFYYISGHNVFNTSPMLVTKSVFKLIFVLSNYQTCTFPLRSVTQPVTFPVETRLLYHKKDQLLHLQVSQSLTAPNSREDKINIDYVCILLESCHRNRLDSKHVELTGLLMLLQAQYLYSLATHCNTMVSVPGETRKVVFNSILDFGEDCLKTLMFCPIVQFVCLKGGT